MLHHIQFETLDDATKMVKTTHTNLEVLFHNKKSVETEDADFKTLLKAYKYETEIEGEGELKHLCNMLDNHMIAVDEEVESFEDNLSQIGLKNKVMQIDIFLKDKKYNMKDTFKNVFED